MANICKHRILIISLYALISQSQFYHLKGIYLDTHTHTYIYMIVLTTRHVPLVQIILRLWTFLEWATYVNIYMHYNIPNYELISSPIPTFTSLNKVVTKSLQNVSLPTQHNNGYYHCQNSQTHLKGINKTTLNHLMSQNINLYELIHKQYNKKRQKKSYLDNRKQRILSPTSSLLRTTLLRQLAKFTLIRSSRMTRLDVLFHV